MNRRQEFISSKCDRCGRATSLNHGGLIVLLNEWGYPLGDQGCFCEKCFEKYDKDDWLSWFKTHRSDWVAKFTQ